MISSTNNTKNIYNKSISKVVEIRVSNDNINFYFGTGCFISKNIILTNKHVIEDELKVTYNTIQYRKYNEENFQDIISLKKKYLDIDLYEIEVNNNEDYFKIRTINIGSKCYAIGNSSGNGLTFLEGVISNKTIIILEDSTTQMIASSVSLTRGMSGGALIDNNGYLVGILTLRLRDTDNTPIYAISYSIDLSFYSH
ncbi:MAG: serine protease [Acholeplasmatales bacterium]|jgi:S1-C subfamily serine protease|nr:serine protease [Acholeplasmatales bacterium]